MQFRICGGDDNMPIYKLNDVCEFITDGTHQTPTYCEDGGVIFLSSKDVTSRKIDWENAKHIPDELHAKLYKRLAPQRNDILLAKNGTTGVAAIVDRDDIFNVYVSLAVLRPKKEIYPHYLLYAINSSVAKRQFNAGLKGIGVPNLHLSVIRNARINVCHYEQQVKICDRLEKISNIIEARKQELQLLDDLIKARFVELFGDENNSKNWDIVNVEEVADVQVGVVIKPSQYYTDERNGIRAFRSLNVGAGFIKDDDWVYFTEEGHRKNSKSILKENDLLIVRSGAPGTSCVVTGEYAGYNAIDIIIAHPDCEKVNPYYLCTFTNMPHGKKQIDEGTGGAAQQHFNVGKYNKLQLMLPPKVLQDEFAEFCKQTDKSKFHTEENII